MAWFSISSTAFQAVSASRTERTMPCTPTALTAAATGGIPAVAGTPVMATAPTRIRVGDGAAKPAG
jgi:hypothetical protein